MNKNLSIFFLFLPFFLGTFEFSISQIILKPWYFIMPILFFSYVKNNIPFNKNLFFYFVYLLFSILISYLFQENFFSIKVTFLIFFFIFFANYIANNKHITYKNYYNFLYLLSVFIILGSFITYIFLIGPKITYFFNYEYILRATFIFKEPNELSVYLIIPFIFFYLKIFFFNKSFKNIFFLDNLFFVLCIIIQLLTFSRVGIVVYIFIILFTTFSLGKVKIFQLIFYLLLASVYFAYSGIESLVLERVSDITNLNNPSTLFRVNNIIEIISLQLNNLDILLFGGGIGSTVIVTGQPTSSNVIIDILFEHGIIGILIHLVILFNFIKSTKLFSKTFFKENNSIDYKFFIYCLSKIGIFSLLLAGMTYATLKLVIFWFLIGLFIKSNEKFKFY